MPTAAGQDRQPLPEGSIQPLDVGGVDLHPALRDKQLLGDKRGRATHALGGDLPHLFPRLGSVLDDAGDSQGVPHLPARTPRLPGTGDFLAKSPHNRVGISPPTTHTHQHGTAHPNRAQVRTCFSNRSASARSRWALTTPPNPKRVETIKADPNQAIQPRPLTRISSAWTCSNSKGPCATTASWTAWHCRPARSRQAATVRSSNPYALTIAWIGQPYASNVTTLTTSVGSVRKPANSVPVRSLNVFWQQVHLYRRRFRPWITIFPAPR